MSQKRFDFRKLEKATKTDSGFLKVPVYATRVGVFNYTKADGTKIRELRPRDEVFQADSMESLAGVPLTNRHPTEMVNSTNSKRHMVGYTSDKVDQEGQFIKTSVTITDSETIKEIENDGLREVSCGYTCDLEFKKGIFNGDEYDAIQRNIRYNHLAIVDKGRAGPEVRLHLDSDSALCDDLEDKPPTQKKGNDMAKVKLCDAEFEVESGVAQAIQAALKEAKTQGKESVTSELETKIETVKADAQKTLDGLQAKLDQSVEEVKTLKAEKTDAAKLHELVLARTALLDMAKPHLKKDADLSAMSESDIKKAVVTAKYPELKLDEKSEAYVEARFDAIIETKEEKKDDLKKTLSKVDDNRSEEIETADQVRTKNSKLDAEAWMKPIGYQLK